MFSRWNLRKWTLPFLLTFSVGLGMGSVALGSNDPENPRPWPEQIHSKLRSTIDETFVNLSSALFNSLSDLQTDLFTFPENGHIGIDLHRDVLDNFDLLNTYTVIDRARVTADAEPVSKLTTWSEDIEKGGGIITPTIGIIFEPQTSIEWTDVRQVKAFSFKKEVRQNNLELASFSNPIPAPSPALDPDLSELNPDISLGFMDPSKRARFSKILNLVTFPLRLPLHRADVRRMQDGEILGYAFDGQIEIGLGANLKVIPSQNILNAGIDFRGTFIDHGRFQISVLREDARFVRVKVSKLNETGSKERFRIHGGMILFKDSKIEVDHVLKYNLNFVPLDWEASQLIALQSDVMYRYDLDSEEGKNAFHKAVLGNFALSDELTFRNEGREAKTVEKLLRRIGERKTTTDALTLDASGILKLDWNTNHEALEAVLELPDGTHHLLEGFREKYQRGQRLFGTTDKSNRKRMTLYMDADLFAKGDPESVFMMAEVTEENSNTRARELNNAINRMETFLRKTDLLPMVAENVPDRTHSKNIPRAWYGRSSFYYGYSIGLNEIEAFLKADRATVERAARKYLHGPDARRLLEAWQRATNVLESNPRAPVLFNILKKLFISKVPVEALTSILFDTLPPRAVDYFITAQNIAFGRVQDHGKTMTSIETALTNADREMGLESYAQRLKQDSEAQIKDMHLDALTSGLSMLHFTLDQTPANVFFRLFRVTGYKRQKWIAEMIVNNRSGRFHVGENTLILDPDSTDLLISKLSRDLVREETYNLSIAYSRNSDRFGPVSSSKFEVDAPYPAPHPTH